MLSRLATKFGKLNEKYGFERLFKTIFSSAAKPMSVTLVRTTASAPASGRKPGKKDDFYDPWDNPERDYVNFPRPVQLENTPPVRHLWVPESFFKYLYPKTGVTGPYALVGGFTTFLLSKELWVIEHEFWMGLELAFVLGCIMRFAGPQAKAYLNESVEKKAAEIDALQKAQVDKQQAEIDAEKEAQYMASSFEELFQAKKEAVGLQLEAEYRARLQEAYTTVSSFIVMFKNYSSILNFFSQVKKRLDYQLELSNVLRRVEQKHMVDWIISNVRKSITAKQEEDALKKCVADLKAMAK